MGELPSSLDEVKAAVGKALHYPDNLGIEFRAIGPDGDAGPGLLALYVRGLAEEELIHQWVIAPLSRGLPAGAGAGQAMGLIPAPRRRTERRLASVVHAVLSGFTAVFVEGASEAVLVGTQGDARRPAGTVVHEESQKETFGTELMANLALIRKRLRDPALIAQPQKLPRGRGAAAVLYLHGRADPDLIDRVRRWVRQRTGEEAMHRGVFAGMASKVGFLPETLTTRWPDRATALLDAGYVVVLMDGLSLAYIAPVTGPALLFGPLDSTLVRPIGDTLRLIRLGLAGLTLIAGATVVALMNYHQEMMPTPFLLALGSVRESAPFPIVFEVLLLELLQEIIREAGFHLPGRLAPGAALIAGKVLLLILVQGGVVGALQGGISVAMAFVMLGFLNYELIYTLRIWRFVLIVGAGVFGFFGIAAIGFLMASYLTQATSFGVPFLGETGLHFTAPGRSSSSVKGVGRRAARQTVR